MIAGFAFTVKQLEHVALDVGEFLTVTSRAESTAAAASIETSTNSTVDETNATQLTVTPVPSNETVAPAWNPTPPMPMS